MKRTVREALSLDDQVEYRIVVSGLLEGECMSLRATKEFPTGGTTEANRTVITGVFDQAALHGLLRRIYSLGFPLISVNQVNTTPSE